MASYYLAKKKLKIEISTGKIIGLIAVLLFIFFLIYIRLFPSEYASTVIYKDPQNYIETFNDSTQKQLKLNITTTTKQHNPIVDFVYNKNFNVQVFKIDSIGAKSLKDYIVNAPFEINNNGSFDGIPSGDCYIFYRMGFHKTHKLYLKVTGKGVDIQKRSADQFIIHINNLSKFLIAYTATGDAFIRSGAGRSSDDPANISCELLLLRKDGFLYFAFIAPEVKGISVPHGTFLSMIN